MAQLPVHAPRSAQPTAVYIAGFDGRAHVEVDGWEPRELEVANVLVAIMGAMHAMLDECPELLRLREGQVNLLGIHAAPKRVAVVRTDAEGGVSKSDEEWVSTIRASITEEP